MLKLTQTPLVIISLLTLMFSLSAHAQSDSQRQKHFNTGGGNLAISGYDPVSYQLGTPRVGSRDYSWIYKGIHYRFASQKNKDTFKANPDKYEPACGGWCAWAMLDGDKVEIDPKSYRVIGGRLHLFFDGIFSDTRAKWIAKRDDSGQAKRVAQKWQRFVPSK